jgi:hypothetical protein
MSAPQTLQVLAVKDGRPWGTISIVLTGGWDVQHPEDALPIRAYTGESVTETVVPGVTRRVMVEVGWSLISVPVQGDPTTTDGYLYLADDDPPLSEEDARRLLHEGDKGGA